MLNPSEAPEMPKVDPIMAKLGEKAEGESVVELRGYVGRIKRDHVRLYLSRAVASYLDIPRSGIVHFVDPKDENEATRIFVAASAQIRYASIKTVAAVEIQSHKAAKCSCSADKSGAPQPARPMAFARSRSFGPGGSGLRFGSIFSPFDCLMNCEGSLQECIDRGLLGPELCSAIHDLCYAACTF